MAVAAGSWRRDGDGDVEAVTGTRSCHPQGVTQNRVTQICGVGEGLGERAGLRVREGATHVFWTGHGLGDGKVWALL